MSDLALQIGHMGICGGVCSSGTQQFEEQETVVNVASRSKAVSQTHTQYVTLVSVCLSSVFGGRCVCSTKQLHLKRRT